MSDREALALRDPVHGFIRADPLEAELVASRPLQRLRHVHQLGLTFLVFPGAEHTRFGHALGAMHLAGRLYDVLAQRPDSPLDPEPQALDRRRVRAAALLHDVGHAPFSHTAEDLFEDPIGHEEMTRRLLDQTEVRGLCEKHGLPLDTILELLSGNCSGSDRLLSQIISGELDVDKMDYLMRDSLFCGVRYGQFDLERVLDVVEPIRDPESGQWGIGIHEAGVHAVEALVLARYYMFTQVYFNATGKVLELHFNEWLQSTGQRWPTEPERFLAEDDVSTIWRMRRSDSRHAEAVFARRHFVVAAETKEHLSAEEKTNFERRLQPLVERHGPKLLVSNSAKDPHRLDRSRVLVRNGDRVEPLEEASHFIRHLTRIDQYRAYCEPEILDEIRSALEPER